MDSGGIRSGSRGLRCVRLTGSAEEFSHKPIHLLLSFPLMTALSKPETTEFLSTIPPLRDQKPRGPEAPRKQLDPLSSLPSVTHRRLGTRQQAYPNTLGSASRAQGNLAGPSHW